MIYEFVHCQDFDNWSLILENCGEVNESHGYNNTNDGNDGEEQLAREQSLGGDLDRSRVCGGAVAAHWIWRGLCIGVFLPA